MRMSTSQYLGVAELATAHARLHGDGLQILKVHMKFHPGEAGIYDG